MAKWVKIGVAGSAIWIFLLYLLSDEALGIFSFDFFYGSGIDGDMMPLILGGCAVIWLVSYLFLRDEDKKKK